MKRALSALLTLAVLMAWQPQPVAAGWQNAGEISGTAVVEGRPLSGVVIRLRNVETGVLVASTTTNARGEFKFTGIPAGNYVAEAVTSDRRSLLGTSSGISLTAGAMSVSGVTLTTSSAAAAAAGLAGAGVAGAAGAGTAGAAAAGGAFFTTTAGIVTAVAVGAGIAGAIAVAATASPSS